MKKSISDILHNADDKTLERIAAKKQAADSRTSNLIYRKCISRIGADAEEVEVFKAETVRRAPKLYPVLGSVLCLMIICGTVLAMIKFKDNKPLPVDVTPQIMATATDVTETTIVTSADATIKSPAKTNTTTVSVAATDKKTETEQLKAENDDITPTATQKTVIAVRHGTTAKKTTAQKTTKTSSTTATPSTTVPIKVQSGTKQLTTKDIITLSAMKNALTWSDFEEYIHEDIGSGLYIWQFCTSEGYTLKVGGGDLTDKPIYINLVRDFTGESIDIRYNDVPGFIDTQLSTSISSIFSTKLHYSDLTADSVQSLEVSNTYYGNNIPEKLTYNEINQILSLIKNVRFVKKDKYFGSSSINYSTIKITTHNSSTVDFVIQGNSFGIGNYEGYEAEPESLRALDDYVISILTNIPEPITVNVSGGADWCWFNDVSDMRNHKEAVRISAFPNLVFKWNGHERIINIVKNGGIIASVSAQFDAYFADLNSDGYPELCSTHAIGSGITHLEVGASDIRNDKGYSLSERMVNDYRLINENGKMFVLKTDPEFESYRSAQANGEKGILKIENDTLVFVPVS